MVEVGAVCYCLHRGHLVLTHVFIMLFLSSEGRIPWNNKGTSFPITSVANPSSSLPPPPAASLTHSFASKVVQWNLHYCGYNRACEKYSPSVCYRCAPCKCDPICYRYGDCCPDVIFFKPFTHRVKDKRIALIQDQECLSVDVPYWRVAGLDKKLNKRSTGMETDTKNTHRSFSDRFYMVSRCPSNSNQNVKECLELEGLPPVTSSGTGSLVYKNIHCARCHGIKDGVPWDVSVVCPLYNNTDALPSSTHESYLIPLIQRGCNVVYSPPENTTHRPCYSEPSMISKCNQTGQWGTYDAFLSRACGSYLTPKVAEGKIYKNVFCYLCNKKDNSFDPKLAKCRRDPFHIESTFEAKLDYKQLHRAMVSKSFLYSTGYETCDDNGLYDPEERKCRHVSCTFGQRLDSTTGSCQPAFAHVKGLTYQLYFRLKPKAPIHLSGQYADIHHLPSAVEIVLRERLQESNVQIEDLSMSFNTSIGGGRCSHSTINDTVLYARVKCTKLTNQTSLQQSLLSLRHHTFNVVNHRWNISFESVPVKMPWYLIHSSDRQHLHFSKHCVKIVSKNVDRRQDGVIRVGTTTPDPTEEYARMTSPPVIRVSKLLACPLIRLLPQEYTVHGKDDDVYVSWQEEPLSHGDYFMDQDGTITICLSTFLVKLSKNNQRRTSTELLCSLVLLPISFVLLLVCFIIHIALPALRSLPRKNNMLVVLCLAFTQIALWIGYNVPYYSEWCTAMGVICHYFSLCLFLALTVSSYHLYRVFNTMHLSVDFTRDSRTFSKYLCFILTSPIAVVSLVIIISKSSDRMHSPIGYGSVALCFLTSPTAMWVAHFIPLLIFVAISLVLYLVTYSALQSNADLETNVTDERHVHFNFRSCLLVMLTWTLGAIAFQTSLSAMRTAFVVGQCCLGLYVSVMLVVNKRVFTLISATCGSETQSSKNNATILPLDSVKFKEASNTQSSVITTSYKQKDSPKSCGRSLDGYSTDADVFEYGESSSTSRVINDGYSTIESIM